jgi:asparagine synthase (glutamine-hydrolysing)
MAKLASQGAEVVPVTFDLGMAEQAFDQIAYHLDTPATWTALCQWFLAKEIKTHGYKVVLSGEGADELFAGYSRYRILWWFSQAQQDPQLRNYQPLIDLVTVGSNERILATMLDRSRGNYLSPHALHLVRRFSSGEDLVANMSRVEWHTTMQCLLRMADRMMAAYSIENRSPFFDYRLIELAARMPTRHKITPTWSKAVLREVALRLGVSPEIVNNPTKVGLVTPWNKWRAAKLVGGRGAWDRGDFSQYMLSAWRRAYNLSGSEKQNEDTPYSCNWSGGCYRF